MKPVRMLEFPAAAMLFENWFRTYILRYEKTYSSVCGQFGLTEEELSDIAESLDFFVFYYIKNHHGRRVIVDDFKDETGLADALWETLAGLVEENYNTLQMNFIIDRIKDMNLS